MKLEMHSSFGLLERPATICEMVARWAEIKPQQVAIEFLPDQGERSALTYGDLHAAALKVRHRLWWDCQPGDRAILMLPAGPEFVIGFLGCLYAGVLAVPASEPKPKRRNDRLSRVAGDCDPTAVLCNRSIAERIEPRLVCPELAAVPWISLEEAISASDDGGSRPDRRLGSRPNRRWNGEETGNHLATDADGEPWPPADSIAFLQYTSGSTSDPMGVAISHHNLVHNLEMIRLGFGQEFNTSDSTGLKGVFWLPPYHDMGLIGGILEPLYLGGTTVLMPPTSFLKKPLRWLQAVSDERAIISGAPNFAYELCVNRLTPQDRQRLDLSHWEVAFCGAEPIRAETIDRFCETFAASGFRRSSFYPCYGLAEATLLVSGHQAGTEPVVKSIVRDDLEHFIAREVAADSEHDSDSVLRVVGCGQSRLDGEILIVDPETCVPVADGRIGEIWYRGENVATGYWNRPEKSAEVFDARPADRPTDSFLRTGDMGFWSADQLFVTGRLKEMLVVRGRNLFPQDLEAVARAVRSDCIDGVVVFPVGRDSDEDLVLVVEVDRRSDAVQSEALIAQLRMALTDTFEISPSSILLVRPFSLPRTTSGKMQRWLTRQLCEEQSLKVLHRWDRNPPAVAPSNPATVNRNTPLEPAEVEPATTSPGAGNRTETLANIDLFSRGLDDNRISHVAEDIETWLCARLQSHGHLAPQEVTPDRPLAEFGLDSMTTLQLAGEIEDQYRVTLNPIVMWNYPTARHLAHYLAEQIMGEFTEERQPDSFALHGQRSFESLLDEIERMDEQEVLRQLHRR